jgi:hypothetical protein
MYCQLSIESTYVYSLNFGYERDLVLSFLLNDHLIDWPREVVIFC